MDMKNMTVAALSNLAASKAPAPGGGSISAMAGAFAAALTAMVGNLTLGRKGMESVGEEMEALIRRADQIRVELLEDMRRDTEAFDAVMAAMAMPKSEETEKVVRQAALQAALKRAAETPYAVAERAASILPLAEAAIARGNRNAVTDGLCGVMLARTAALGALLNVKINLASIRDVDYVAQMQAKCRALQARVEESEAAILAMVPELA